MSSSSSTTSQSPSSEEKPKSQTIPKPTLSWSSFTAALQKESFAGLLFDIFQLVLSLIDSFSDIAVAVEFHNNERFGFFYAVSVLFLFGCIADSLSFCLPLAREGKLGQRNTKGPKSGISPLANGLKFFLIVAALTPLAPVLPIVHYLKIKIYGEGALKIYDRSTTAAWDVSSSSSTNSSKTKSDNYDDENDDVNKYSSNRDNSQKDHDQDSFVFDGETFLSRAEYLAKHGNTKVNARTMTASQELMELSLNSNQPSKPHSEDDEVIDEESKALLRSLGGNGFSSIINQKTFQSIDQGLLARKASLVLANVQAVCSSLPQCCVQLFAISLANEVTWLQVFSLCLSLFSLVGKSYQVCRSFSLTHFVAKMIFVGFDVFSTALLFSSVFSSSTPSWISWLYVALKIQTALFIIFTLVVLAWYIARENKSFMRRLSTLLGVAVVEAVVFFPIMIAFDIVKFSWLTLCNMFIYAPPSQYFMYPLLHAFLWDQNSTGNDCRKNRKSFRPPNVDWQKSIESNLRMTMLQLLRRPKPSRIINNSPEPTGEETAELLAQTISMYSESEKADLLQQLNLTKKKSNDDTTKSSAAINFIKSLLPSPISAFDENLVDCGLYRIRHVLLCDVFYRICGYDNLGKQLALGVGSIISATSLQTWDKGRIGKTFQQDAIKTSEEQERAEEEAAQQRQEQKKLDEIPNSFSWLDVLQLVVIPHKDRDGDLFGSFKSQNKLDQIATIWLVFTCILNAVFGLAYPFLFLINCLICWMQNFSSQPREDTSIFVENVMMEITNSTPTTTANSNTMNAMTQVCLLCAVPFGIASVYFFSDAIKYQLTCCIGQELHIGLFGSSSHHRNELLSYFQFLQRGTIDSYYSADVASVLKKEILLEQDGEKKKREHVLPRDVIDDHVAGFLLPNHVGLWGMSRKERLNL